MRAKYEEKYPSRFHCQLTDRKLIPALLATVENHVKLTVVDGKYAIVGGTGITDNLSTVGTDVPPKKKMESYADYFDFAKLISPGAARDADSVLVGPLAQSARTEYFNLLQKWETIEAQKENKKAVEAPLRWFRLNGNKNQVASVPEIDNNPRLDKRVKVKLLACGPEQEINPCTQAIEQMILRSDKKLTIAHMFQNRIREIDAALTQKLREGKTEVDIISTKFDISLSNSLKTGESPFWNMLFGLTHDTLSGQNLNLYLYNVADTLYHKKVIVSEMFEEICYAIGSYNLGKKSHSHDDEMMAIVCQTNENESAAMKDLVEALELDKSLSVLDQSVREIDDIADNVFNKYLSSPEFKRAGGITAVVRILHGILTAPFEIIGGLGV